MSTHVPGVQSFSVFLHHSVIDKIKDEALIVRVPSVLRMNRLIALFEQSHTCLDRCQGERAASHR